MGTANQPLVVIVGETASGKSSLAIKVAEKFNGEIISADSWAVRREVGIGAAKPTASEQKRVKHHLIDIVEPCQDFTAAVFKGLALKSIDEIYNRGKLPIIVGGTGLYVDGVIYDFGFLPEGRAGQREMLNQLSIAQLLELIDKRGLSVKNIDIRNKRRLIRLIETDGKRPTRANLRKNTLILGIILDREELIIRIERRVNKMFSAGLEQEVKALSEKYGWDCEALKGIGYYEWKEYFLGSQNLEETRNRIISSTTSLAKRQRTWFKRNKSIHWVSNISKVDDIVTTFLNKKI